MADGTTICTTTFPFFPQFHSINKRVVGSSLSYDHLVLDPFVQFLANGT